MTKVSNGMKLVDFRGKRVLVMGLGLLGGGVSAGEFFLRQGARVKVTDLKTKAQLKSSIAKLRRYKNISFRLGRHERADFRNTDYVIQNPGVPGSSPFLKIAKASGAKVLSDVEIFFLLSPAPIIGITGTKGKTTAASLLAEFLRTERSRKVWLAGNIRTSVLEVLPKIKPRDYVVLELSSFQLDSLARQKVSPHIAAITNIFPDHLNRYASMAEYAESKSHIFKFQKRGDLVVLNRRDATLRKIGKKAPARVQWIDPEKVVAFYRDAMGDRLPTFHFPSVAIAIAIARDQGISKKAITSVLRRFHGVPNRMERVHFLRGVEFINDTTATNPTAALEAVKASKARIGSRHLVVIAGGFDKRLPIGDFMTGLVKNASAVVLLPGAISQAMARSLKGRVQLVRVYSMTRAVQIAFHSARPKGTVLLSPGAASFGLFQNEFDRGDQFTRAVRRLP